MEEGGLIFLDEKKENIGVKKKGVGKREVKRGGVAFELVIFCKCSKFPKLPICFPGSL